MHVLFYDKIESAQREADEVKAIMLENVKKADERRENLSDLNQRAENLQNKVSKMCCLKVR